MIFDLYKLHSSPILDEALASILWDEHILKLGCGVSSDMKSAAKSYSHMTAFKQVRGVVDLRNLFLQYVQVAGLQVYFCRNSLSFSFVHDRLMKQLIVSISCLL